MRSRRLTAVSSFASVGATDDDADRIVAAERAALSRGAKRSDNALLTGVCFMAPLLLFLALVYAVPFLGVAAWSVTLPKPGLGQYERLVADPLVFSVFLRTFRICLIVTVLSVGAAYTIAYVWVRGTRLERRLVEFCILIPFWISILTRAFGWLALLSNRGLINTWLEAAGLIAGPLPLAYNEFSVTLGIAHVLTPFAAFPLASSMRSVDERVLLAARGLGASRLRIFWTSVPADDRLGRRRRGAHRLRLHPRLLRDAGHSRRRPQHHGGGARLAAHVPKPRLGAWRGDQRRAGRAGRRPHGRIVPPGQARAHGGLAMIQRPGLIALLLAGLVSAFLLAPLLAVVPISFTPARFLTMPNGHLSLIHYRELIDDPDWARSILLSLRIGVVSSAIATALALAFSLGVWMLRPRFAALMVGFVLLPMIAPPIVSAMTLYFFLTSLSEVSGAIGYDTWFGVTIAHVVMITPFAVVMILVALAQVDRRLDLAARGLGASALQRVFKVILPNIRFGVMMAALMAFFLSWEEIGVTLFITSVNAITLPRLMWMGVHDNIDPAVAAISVVLIVITTLALTGRMALQREEAA